MAGERFKVDERVENDGYLNYYTIRSDFGDFEAVSTATLRVRSELLRLGFELRTGFGAQVKAGNQ